MYQRQFSVLALDDDPVGLNQLLELLQQRDYAVLGAPGIQAAWSILSQCPIDLLVAAVRLRGTSGLEFLAAARAQHPALAGILVGTDGDQAWEMAAWRHDAPLVLRPFHPPHFLMVVAERLAAIRHRQRWPRKAVGANVPVWVGQSPAMLVDVSYGGLRVALDCGNRMPPSTVTVAVPAAGLAVTAHVVWSSLASDGVTCVCGAAIADDGPLADWRRFVDAIPQAA